MILVTGASGFVGRALIERLRLDARPVRAAVRDESSAAALRQRFPSLELAIVGDIGQSTRWEQALAGCDAVVHLASRVHVMRETVADPLSAFREVNTHGTIALAQAAAAAGVRHFVYLSSVKVHGERTDTQPFRDTDTPHPVDAYGISKWEAEKALLAIAEKGELRVTSLRPPLVYGPRVKGNFLRLLRWVCAAYPVPLAAVNNRRSLLFLGNLVDAVVCVLAHPPRASNSYLLSDDESVSTPTLMRKLAALMHVRCLLWPVPAWALTLAGHAGRQGESIRRLTESLAIDAGRFRQETGWVPPFTLDQGLAQTVEWYMHRDGHD